MYTDGHVIRSVVVRMGSLHIEIIFSQLWRLEVPKVKELPAGLVSPEASVLGLKLALFIPTSHGLSCVSSSSQRYANPTGSGLHLYDLIDP